MGGARGKLLRWAGYEYGRCLGTLPGNCHECAKAHRLLNRPLPCETYDADDRRQCPKYKLHPAEDGAAWPYFGLHPKNRPLAQLYETVARDVRVGMDGVLMHALTAEQAKIALDLYGDDLGNALDRRKAFEMLMLLDQVACAKRREMEKVARADSEARANLDRKRRAAKKG